MLKTLFTDLADLVILDILRYLSSFDAIQAFYNLTYDNDRILNLLVEARCFTRIHHLPLPLFSFVCDNVLPSIGSKLLHLTLYDHQLSLARSKQIISYLTNLSSLHLINIMEMPENNNVLSYFLNKQLKNLKIEFISERHIEAQAHICEQFIFSKSCEYLTNCQLLNNYGLQLKHLNLCQNKSIQFMTVQLKQLNDLHILFDNLLNIQTLNVELCQWTVEDIRYDYRDLPEKLPCLYEFSIQARHTLSFDQLLNIIEYLIHLKQLSFIYNNYNEHGIDIGRLDSILRNFSTLKQLSFVIKFIYFNITQKSTFDNMVHLKEQWNINTHINSTNKTYFAFTQPFLYRTQTISTDILLNDNSIYYPSVTNLCLTIHSKEMCFLSLLRLLSEKYPSITNLHILDPFNMDVNNQVHIVLPKIYSFNLSESKISNLLPWVFRSMPNLKSLYVNLNVLLSCNLKFYSKCNRIRHLELITNTIDEINSILIYFPMLEYLFIDSKSQSNQYQRRSSRILFDWFQISSRLFTIHIKAPKLSDLLFLESMDNEQNIYVQHTREMLTGWR